MSRYSTIKISNDRQSIFESETLINDLSQNYPQNLGIEKTALRKQINLLKTALLKINLENLDHSIYHLKLALLKIAYLIFRKGSNNYLIRFKDFLEKETTKFINDLELIKSDDLKDKKQAVETAKKVYKDFLNAIIIKSYFPKDQNDQHHHQKIPNQGSYRPSHRRR